MCDGQILRARILSEPGRFTGPKLWAPPTSLQCSNLHTTFPQMWIGLSIKNYVWSWEGGPRSSYTNWAPQEPGNFVSVEGKFFCQKTSQQA